MRKYANLALGKALLETGSSNASQVRKSKSFWLSLLLKEEVMVIS